MDKYTYLILNILFFTPIVIWIFLHYKKYMMRYKKLLFMSLIFGIVQFFLVDPVAIIWGAWGYDYSKTLGITMIGNTVIEEFLWFVLLCVCMALITAVLAEKEEKKKTFKSFFK